MDARLVRQVPLLDVLQLLLEDLQMVGREEGSSILRWVWKISVEEVPISQTRDDEGRRLDIASLVLVKPGRRQSFDLRGGHAAYIF